MSPHAGEKIKEYLKASGMKVGEFAKLLNCHRQNVYDIFKRQDIDLQMLQRISKVLDHDFVTELYVVQKPSKVILKFVVTVELENGECRVIDVQTTK